VGEDGSLLGRGAAMAPLPPYQHLAELARRRAMAEKGGAQVRTSVGEGVVVKCGWGCEGESV